MPRKSKVQAIVEEDAQSEADTTTVLDPKADGQQPVIVEPTEIPPEPVKPAQPATPAVEEVEEEEEEEAPRAPLTERLGDLDDSELEELLGMEKISGRLRSMIEERAEEQRRQEDLRRAAEKQAEQDKADQEYLRRLRKTDPVKYNEELDRREALAEAQQLEVERIRTVTNEFQKRLGTYVSKNIPATIAEQFRGKDYTKMDLIDGVIQYMDDIIKTSTKDLRAKIESELRPVIRKQILTELNGNTEETPQPASGPSVRPRRNQTQKHDFGTEAEVAEAFAKGMAGLPGGITREEMIAWYRSHGIRR